MEPKEACVKASGMALAGDLQGAVDILEPILEEYREFGPAYTLHAKVFLMAGDAAQPIIDLDAAEWANREYGTSDDILAVTELRAVTYAVRTIYAPYPVCTNGSSAHRAARSGCWPCITR